MLEPYLREEKDIIMRKDELPYTETDFNRDLLKKTSNTFIPYEFIWNSV
jgi:hypothetical protein